MVRYGFPTKVEEIMTKKVVTVGPDVTALEAAKLMRDNGIGCLVVIEDGNMIGIVTERDLVVRAIAAGSHPMWVKIREFMTPKVLTCSPETTIAEVNRIMSSKGIRRLPVVNKEGKLVGIVTSRDIAHYGYVPPPSVQK